MRHEVKRACNLALVFAITISVTTRPGALKQATAFLGF